MGDEPEKIYPDLSLINSEDASNPIFDHLLGTDLKGLVLRIASTTIGKLGSELHHQELEDLKTSVEDAVFRVIEIKHIDKQTEMKMLGHIDNCIDWILTNLCQRDIFEQEIQISDILANEISKLVVSDPYYLVYSVYMVYGAITGFSCYCFNEEEGELSAGIRFKAEQIFATLKEVFNNRTLSFLLDKAIKSFEANLQNQLTTIEENDLYVFSTVTDQGQRYEESIDQFINDNKISKQFISKAFTLADTTLIDLIKSFKLYLELQFPNLREKEIHHTTIRFIEKLSYLKN